MGERDRARAGSWYRRLHVRSGVHVVPCRGGRGPEALGWEDRWVTGSPSQSGVAVSGLFHVKQDGRGCLGDGRLRGRAGVRKAGARGPGDGARAGGRTRLRGSGE